MPNFTKFQHVERLGKEDTEGLLQNNNIVVTAKVDGTNASIWLGEDGKFKCGSRTRELSQDKDNAGFWAWCHDCENQEAISLYTLVQEHPNIIVYGEYMGPTNGRFVGSIKDYNDAAHGTFYIFDVFDVETGCYLADNVWRPILAQYNLEPYFVEILATLNCPTVDDIAAIAQKNTFLLDTANHPGEGVVLKAHNWRNRYGRQQYGKFVLDEYKQVQKAKKVKAQIEDVEQWIVDNFVTDSELSKAIAKTEVQFDEVFDNHCGAHIGFLLNIVWNDDVLDEMKNILKKTKNPTIDFGVLKNLCNNKVKAYAGIG